MNELATIKSELSAGQNTENMFCSIDTSTNEGKALAFKAMNNTDKKLADFVGKVINMQDVYAEHVMMDKKDESGKPICDANGEIVKAPATRVVIIDDKGNAYSCVSTGIFNALQKLFFVYGVPHYDEPLPVEVVQINKGNRRILTLNPVG